MTFEEWRASYMRKYGSVPCAEVLRPAWKACAAEIARRIRVADLSSRGIDFGEACARIAEEAGRGE